MKSGPDYILDLSTSAAGSTPAASRNPRPWIAIFWKCCHVYNRIYRQPDSSFYHGRCPRCLTPVRLRVGPGGTTCRFFEAE